MTDEAFTEDTKVHLESGGHGGSCLDGEWLVSDTPRTGRYPESIA